MITDYATNQLITPDHNISGTRALSDLPGQFTTAGGVNYGWPNNKPGLTKYSDFDTTGLQRIADITDGTNYTVLCGETSADQRMYDSGSLAYRDGAFSGGGEVSRAISSGGVLSAQTVYADQKISNALWSTFRATWGTPHPGGQTVCMCDGSVTSIPVGTIITALINPVDNVPVPDGILNR